MLWVKGKCWGHPHHIPAEMSCFYCMTLPHVRKVPRLPVIYNRSALWTVTSSPVRLKRAGATERPPQRPAGCCCGNTPSIARRNPPDAPHQKGQHCEHRGAAPPQPSPHSETCPRAVRTQSTWNTISPEEPISGRKRASVNTFPSSRLLLPGTLLPTALQLTADKHRHDLSHQSPPHPLPKQPLLPRILDRGCVVREATLSVMELNRFSSQQQILSGCLRNVVSGLKQLAAALSAWLFKGHKTTHVESDKHKRDCSYPYFDVLRSQFLHFAQQPVTKA